MSGHSKWHGIRHKKAIIDARRGKLFTKLLREITVAARLGGGDSDANPRLRAAIDDAKAANVPNDNIERAVKKGTGELAGAALEEVAYEGYGPGGVALLIEAMTDNRNRTVSEVRHLLAKHGGSLGESGCVAWMFQKRGLFLVDRDAVDEDQLVEAALEGGAEDIGGDEDHFELTCLPEAFEAVRRSLEEAGIPRKASRLAMVPQGTVQVEGAQAEQLVRLLDALEDHDDVQNVWANFEMDERLLERAEA